MGIVQRVFAKLNKKGYIDEDRLGYTKTHKKGPNIGKEYFQIGPKYILNLNIFFDYLKQTGTKLSQIEKNYINLIFSYTPIRKAVCKLFPEDHIVDSIFKFYLKFLIFPCALKSEYVEQTENIKKDREHFEKVDKYLLNDSKYRKELRRVIRNPAKISNTSAIIKMCKKHLKENFDSKRPNPVKYAKEMLRPSYLIKHDDRIEGKFIKR